MLLGEKKPDICSAHLLQYPLVDMASPLSKQPNRETACDHAMQTMGSSWNGDIVRQLVLSGLCCSGIEAC
jgi:hypothetical protein